MVRTVNVSEMTSSVVGHFDITIRLAHHLLVGDVRALSIKGGHSESGQERWTLDSVAAAQQLQDMPLVRSSSSVFERGCQT
jgi:hypothetical protein